jgi:hypothetical protein
MLSSRIMGYAATGVALLLGAAVLGEELAIPHIEIENPQAGYPPGCLGSSMAMDGDTLIVGAKYSDRERLYAVGIARVYVRDGMGGWSLQAELAADDPFEFAYFGASVAISGDTAVVGANLDSRLGKYHGAAYVFTRTNGVWTQEAKLVADDASENDIFGDTVAISGNTIMVGVSNDDDNGTNSGSVYVYVRSEDGWHLTEKLYPADAKAAAFFGLAVSISGDTAIIGMASAAYVFVHSDNTWLQQAKLLTDEVVTACSMAEDTAVLGMAYDTNMWAIYAGSVQVYRRANGVWTREAILSSDVPTERDFFGQSVSISGDTLVVGADGDDNVFQNDGAAYVFERVGSNWTRKAILIADDGAESDHFGSSILVKSDTIIVGAISDDDGSYDSGSVYVFGRQDATWNMQTKLSGPFDAAENDGFGTAVAISGDTAIVGAPGDGNDEGTIDVGTAYVLTCVDGNWVQQAKLTAFDGAINDHFGSSVAISGDTAVIGTADPPGRGAVYVYTRTGGAWTEQAKLLVANLEDGDYFGRKVAISGDTIFIGVPGDDHDTGSVYVFKRSGEVWSEQAKLIPWDVHFSYGKFGKSIFISGNTAVIGSDYSDFYVYVLSGGTWNPHAKLTICDYGGFIASPVSISNDTIVLGLASMSVGGVSSGAAYVFTRSGENWLQQAMLVADDAAKDDNFGQSVSISGEIAVIGAYDADAGGTNSGAAYVFTRSGGIWTQKAKLVVDDAMEDDRFGNSVSIDQDWIIVGAGQKAGPETNSGKAYAFKVTNTVSFQTDGTPGATLAGGVAELTQTVFYNDSCAPVVANAPAGHAFTGWGGDSVGFDNPLTVTSVTADMAITANFAPIEDTALLTVNHTGHGTTNFAGMFTVEKGIPVGLAATPDVGHHVFSWSGTAGATIAEPGSQYTTVTLSQDATVTASFAINVYSLTYAAGEGGSIIGAASQTVTHGANGIAVLAAPDEGYNFVDWSDASTADSRQELNVTSDRSFTANFALNEYRVEFRTDGTEMATITGDLVQTMTHGGNCTPVEAVSSVFSEFFGWSGDYIGAENPLMITNVTRDMVITADFQANKVACGSVFDIEAAAVEGLPNAGFFLVKPKVYSRYRDPVTLLDGKTATAKVLTKVAKPAGVASVACEWTKKVCLFARKAFKAAQADGIDAATWLGVPKNQGHLSLPMRLKSIEAGDRPLGSAALMAPEIDDVASSGVDAKGNALLTVTGSWFGVKKPKVWREYTDDKTGAIKGQAMKVLAPVDPVLANAKGKPACMDAATGASRVIVVVPPNLPKGNLNGILVLDNGVGLAAGATPDPP